MIVCLAIWSEERTWFDRKRKKYKTIDEEEVSLSSLPQDGAVEAQDIEHRGKRLEPNLSASVPTLQAVLLGNICVTPLVR